MKNYWLQSIEVRELKINPEKLIDALKAEENIVITKKSKPIGLVLSLDKQVMTNELYTGLLIDAYKDGIISLGQLSCKIDCSKEQCLKVLSLMGIDVIEYDFKDDVLIGME